MDKAHPEDVAEQARLERDARDDEPSCPPHCCCCGPGEPCCDCGVVPAPEPARVVPNRLSSEVSSPYYDAAALPDLQVFRNGKKLSHVVEYSVTGKWARVHMLDGRGQPKCERGRIVTVTLFGAITAKYEGAK